MNALANMARLLGGDVVGHQISCPGPGHSPEDRSLSVRLSPTAPEGFVVYTHANGDDIYECRDHVRRLLGWGDRRGEAPPRRDVLPVADRGHQDDEAAKIARAVAIWKEARHPAGTIVQTYLASRKLELPGCSAGEAIRFHPACPWRDGERTIRVPAMVAAMRSIETGEVTAVHRTRLTPDGQKVDRRMLGKASGAAIMLIPYSAVGAGLAIGEGIETTIAGMMLGWRDAWAMGSVGGIERFPLITGLQSLILFAETGDNGASQRALDVVGERYWKAKREVIILEPACGGDLNDVLRMSA